LNLLLISTAIRIATGETGLLQTWSFGLYFYILLRGWVYFLMSFVLEIWCRHKWGGYECYFLSSKSFCKTYTELAPFHLSSVCADNNRNDVSLSVFRRDEYCFNEIFVAYMHFFYRLHFVMSSRGMHYQFCNSSTFKCIYLRSFIVQFCI